MKQNQVIEYSDIRLDGSSYYQHEQWFKICDVKKIRQVENLSGELHGVRIVNSYGRVRDVYENGQYYEVSPGEAKQYDEYDRVEPSVK